MIGNRQWRARNVLAGITLGVAAIAIFVVGRAQAKDAAAGGTIDHIQVHGRSLEGNLQGDPAERDVTVYLPHSYSTDRSRRYPVVYLLHGYGRTVDKWVPFIGLPGSADRDIAAGTAREMILVLPDANTLYGGSMYSSSPTTGDWETYITHDLVGYIDSHYRTLATRESRGLGGHSMGGYGVWRIAMKHPEVYSSIYALSPCCLMNNPQPPAPGRQSAPAKAPAANATGDHGKGAHEVNVQFGEAAAWSPNPQNPPQFFDLPVKEGKLQPEIAAKWLANSPAVMVDQYVYNLRRYDAIAMDVGLQDTLVGSIKEFDGTLMRLKVPHTFETYQGDHSDHLQERVEQKVLPFFSQHLAFAAARGAKGK